MLSGDFYHGTSSHRLDQIRQEGFRLFQEDWGKWLCARGVYLVRNRPLVALFHAKWATKLDRSNNEESEPVVIRVTIRWHDEKRILNLTTEGGMQELFFKYSEVKKQYGSKEGFLIVEDKIIKSIMEYIELSDEDKKNYVRSMFKGTRTYEHFKWDCAVITSLVKERGYAAVIAVFQEGLSGAFDYFEHKYNEKNAISYQGIRYRDSIMVCITDLDWIGSEFTEIEFSSTHEGYLNKVSNIGKDKV